MKMYFSNEELKVMEEMMVEFGFEFNNFSNLVEGTTTEFHADDLKFTKLLEDRPIEEIEDNYGTIVQITRFSDGYSFYVNKDFVIDYMHIYKTGVVSFIKGITDLYASIKALIKPMVEKLISDWKIDFYNKNHKE